MPTTWTNDVKLEGQTNTTYNDATVTYSQTTENYSGQVTTIWTNDSKS